jgi:hypothetical protein
MMVAVKKVKFMQKSSKHFNPYFPHFYDIRKSELGLDRLISKEKNRLIKDRLKAIKYDLKLIQKL